MELLKVGIFQRSQEVFHEAPFQELPNHPVTPIMADRGEAVRYVGGDSVPPAQVTLRLGKVLRLGNLKSLSGISSF